MKKFGWLGAILVACSLLAACGGERNQNSADLRVIHAVPDAEPLDVYVNDDLRADNVAYGGITGFVNFTAGPRQLFVRSTTDNSTLHEREINFIDGTRTTLALLGSRSAMITLRLLDDYVKPSAGKIQVRVASFTQNIAAVDLYFNATGNITDATPQIAGIPYGNLSAYLNLDEGNYAIVLTSTGTKDVVFRADARNFPSGSQNTIATFPATGGALVNGMLITMDGATMLSNPSARVKAVNAIPGATLTYKAGTDTIAQNVVFTQGSTYVTTGSGARALTIEASNVPGTPIATLPTTLAPAGDFTLVAVNTLTQPELVTFSDANFFPAAGYANVRFANALPTAAAVDVKVKGETKATNLAYKSVTPTTPYVIGTDFVFTFTTPGGGTTIATTPATELVGNAVYTVYLTGPPEAPLVTLIRDR